MNTEKNLSKDKQIHDLSKITEDEIYSDIWSRVTLNQFETCRTYVYCKKEKLKDDSRNIEWFYELSAEDNPKDNLNRYLSGSESDHKYSDRDRRKIFYNDEFGEFVLDDEKWLYYENKRHQVDVESLDGTYQESFIIEHSESFSSIPIYEQKNYKSDHKYIRDLLNKKLNRSIIVRNKNGHLVSILDEDSPPGLFVDRFSGVAKKLFLLGLLIPLMFVGGFTFLIPIWLLTLLFSPPVVVLLSFAYILLGCKYMVLLMMAYPVEIASRIGNYIYRDKYELKPTYN